MSVQLIVYPQYFDGSPNPLATASTEYIVDAINFNTVNLSSSFVSSASSGLVMQDAIDNYTSISVNTWGRYKNTLSNVPTESSNSLLFTPSTNAGAGIIQKLSNLTVGANYNVTLVLATAFTGTLTIRLYTGTILQSSTVYASPSGTITESFTANSTSDTILIVTGKHKL